METYCNVSESQHRPTEARTVKLLWIWNMEREQWNQTRTKLGTDAKSIPNKLSNNEQCPRPVLCVPLRLKTRQQASGEQTDTDNVGGKTDQTLLWENSLVRSTSSRLALSKTNSQKMFCLESSVKFPALSVSVSLWKDSIPSTKEEMSLISQWKDSWINSTDS